jgi:hypothetical protein
LFTQAKERYPVAESVEAIGLAELATMLVSENG